MDDVLAGKKRRIAELKASLNAKLSELEEVLAKSLDDATAEVSALRDRTAAAASKSAVSRVSDKRTGVPQSQVATKVAPSVRPHSGSYKPDHRSSTGTRKGGPTPTKSSTPVKSPAAKPAVRDAAVNSRSGSRHVKRPPTATATTQLTSPHPVQSSVVSLESRAISQIGNPAQASRVPLSPDASKASTSLTPSALEMPLASPPLNAVVVKRSHKKKNW